MMPTELTAEERNYLLKLARESIESAVNGHEQPEIDEQTLAPAMRELGAVFVTLTIHGDLRGCIGTLEPYQSLVEDVREHAISAALDDYRFMPVRPSEIPSIRIEISRLSLPVPLDYQVPAELASKLRPGVDGVILREGIRRATFLPQVWEKIPDSEQFLDHLCEKMGVPPNYWRSHKLQVFIYRVEEFQED